MANHIQTNFRVYATLKGEERVLLREFKECVANTLTDNEGKEFTVDFDFNKIIKEDREAKEYQDGVENYCGETFNWYAWRCDHWGTKWNCYEVEYTDNGTSLSYSFQTAWNFAKPIFEKIAKMFPHIRIEGEYADEDLGSNCANFIVQGGKLFVNDGFESDKEQYAFACNVWGYDSPQEIYDFNEEEGSWEDMFDKNGMWKR